MHELAAVIRDNLDTLVEEYDRRLRGVESYAAMPDRIKRGVLNCLAASLESADDAEFIQFVQTAVEKMVALGLATGPLLQGLVVLEEVIVPLVSTVGDATFLWRAFSRARAIVSFRTAEMLQESRAKYMDLYENANDMLFTVDLEGRFTSANQVAYTALGYTREDVYEKNIFDVLTPASANFAFESLQKAIVQGSDLSELQPWEFEVVRRDGSKRLFEVRTRLIREEGEIAGFQGIARDVTERKRAEQALEEQQAFLRQVIDINPNFVFVRDREGRFILANRAIAEVYGTTIDGLIGKTDADFNLNAKEVERIRHGDLEVMDSLQEMFIPETCITDVEGNVHWFQTIKRPLVDEDGVARRVLGVSSDITERKRLEQAMQESLEHRGRQVQTSTEIAQEIAAAPALDELFHRVVTLIKERFGYYHAQLFLLKGDNLVTVAGYGRIGQQLLEQGHFIPVGKGVVGRAGARGEPVLSPDVRQDPEWLYHPMLPDTESELAVPIKLRRIEDGEWRDKVLGILDVQSDTAGALTEEDRFLLEGLCGQIAIAIEDTRLRQEMEEHLRELERITRAMSREGWETLRREAGPIGYLFDQTGVVPANDFWAPEIGLAAERKALVPPTADVQPVAVAPLSVHGEIIGALGVQDDPQHPLSQDDLALIESVSEQVALALESARLFEQTQTALAETATLYAGSERVVRAATVDEVLQALIHSTALGKFDRANIMLFDHPWGDERPENLIVTAVWGHSGEETRAPVGTSYPTDKFPLMSLVARDGPTIFGDIATTEGMDEDLRALLIERLHMRSLVLWPLVVGGQWIGILAGQSNTMLEMNEDEMRQITSLTDQAAAVIQNQRLLEQTQEALEEVEATHRLYLREQWARFVPARVAPLYERARSDVAPLDDAGLPAVEQAMRQREVVVQSGGDGGDEQAAVVAPITLRGEVIGALGLHEAAGGRQWTDDEIALVESVAEQLALAVENVRLLEETQRRAQRDRIIADITAKVRSSADVETIMRTAVRELGTALDADRAFVQLSTGTPAQEAGSRK